jgi:hypothetical protein
VGWLMQWLREAGASFMGPARKSFGENFVRTCSKYEDPAICRCAGDMLARDMRFRSLLWLNVVRLLTGRAPASYRSTVLEAVRQCKRNAVRDAGWSNLET